MSLWRRAAGGAGGDEAAVVEYDMDSADSEWLEAFNGGQDRLPPDRFERMLWILDLTNSKAIERTFTAAGAPPDTRTYPRTHACKMPQACKLWQQASPSRMASPSLLIADATVQESGADVSTSPQAAPHMF